MSILALAWSGIARIGAPAARWWLRRRAARGKEIAGRLDERAGIDPTPRPSGTLIWIHAASVGETMSILPVLAELAAADVQVLLTTGTTTAARLLEDRLPALGLHEHVRQRFAPLDVPQWAAGFLDHWQPDVAGFVESELWPNLLAGCRTRGIRVVLINARLSARSFARWRRLPRLSHAILAGVTQTLAQSQVDAHRFRALGAARVSTPGNLKFAAQALPADAGDLARLGALLAGRPTWIAASTHPGEDDLVFTAHRDLARRHPGLLTILAPRHPERGGSLAAAARQAGLAVTTRSAGQLPPAEGIWIADTLGELGLFYRLAPITFVGRSLIAPGGGQNPLEPARLGCAVAVGPHTDNFPDLVATLEHTGALARVANLSALVAWVDAMLRDPASRAVMGRAGALACARQADLPAQIARTLLRLAEPGPGVELPPGRDT
ncbi:MAG: 3-deoxy-D-manno-octulosonic acid transferase [Acetobacteraceae bacterium]|nr:3-deoxy-D-manno-octulosonic acid transferase [Acetobacteraceae bacterium]